MLVVTSECVEIVTHTKKPGTALLWTVDEYGIARMYGVISDHDNLLVVL